MTDVDNVRKPSLLVSVLLETIQGNEMPPVATSWIETQFFFPPILLLRTKLEKMREQTLSTTPVPRNYHEHTLNPNNSGIVVELTIYPNQTCCFVLQLKGS